MIENHKCFDFHGGCVRETKIHFAHDEEEFQQIQKGASTTPSALKREIFVGGLPPTVDSGKKLPNYNLWLLCF